MTTKTNKNYQKRAKAKNKDLFLPGWNYRSSKKQAKFLLAKETNPLVRKIMRDMLRMSTNKYVRN